MRRCASARVDESERNPVNAAQGLFNQLQGVAKQVGVVVADRVVGASDRTNDGAASAEDLQLGQVEDPLLLASGCRHQQVKIVHLQHLQHLQHRGSPGTRCSQLLMIKS